MVVLALAVPSEPVQVKPYCLVWKAVKASSPETVLFPLHPPDAEQLETLRPDHERSAGRPGAMTEGTAEKATNGFWPLQVFNCESVESRAFCDSPD